MKDTLSTTLTLNQINDDYAAFQEELTLRDKHLKLLISFKSDDIDDTLKLLGEAYVIEEPDTTELIAPPHCFDAAD